MKNFKEIVIMYRAQTGFTVGYYVKKILYIYSTSNRMLHKKVKQILKAYDCSLAEVYQSENEISYEFEKIIYLKSK